MFPYRFLLKFYLSKYDKEFYENCLKNKLRKYYADAIIMNCDMNLVSCPREMAYILANHQNVNLRNIRIKITLDAYLEFLGNKEENVMTLYSRNLFAEESKEHIDRCTESSFIFNNPKNKCSTITINNTDIKYINKHTSHPPVYILGILNIIIHSLS